MAFRLERWRAQVRRDDVQVEVSGGRGVVSLAHASERANADANALHRRYGVEAHPYVPHEPIARTHLLLDYTAHPLCLVRERAQRLVRLCVAAVAAQESAQVRQIGIGGGGGGRAAVRETREDEEVEVRFGVGVEDGECVLCVREVDCGRERGGDGRVGQFGVGPEDFELWWAGTFDVVKLHLRLRSSLWA